jgi:simple sugar transport system permease protein
MSSDLVVHSIATALAGGTAVLIAATGELIVEKTGVYNLGIEGVMLVGALAAFITGQSTGSWVAGLIAGAAVGAVFVLLFAMAVVFFGADMMMAGLALVLLATGAAGAIGAKYLGVAPKVSIPTWHIPGLSDISYVGPAFFRQLSVGYLALLMPAVVWVVLNRTRWGLNLQAVGENPTAADMIGIHVKRTRVAAIMIGGAFAGFAGGVITLGVVHQWVYGVTGGQGWIALAIVIFAGWRPVGVIAGAWLFGGLGTIGNVGQALGWHIPSQFFSSLPYLGSLLVLIAVAVIRKRRRGLPPWPAALGQAFARG